MPASKAQQRAVAKYMKNNYDEVKVRVPKGRKEDISEFAREKGMSINNLVNSLLCQAMQWSEEDWKKTGQDEE